MTVTYALLSPTFGMHQYTADLANRMADRSAAGCVELVTTTNAPAGRYRPEVRLRTAVQTRGTGFSREGFDPAAYRAARAELLACVDRSRGDRGRVVHFTGVHLWNVPLVYALRRRGVRVVHTLHDLAPHSGVRHATLIRLWSRLIVASGATILVHGRCYRDQLLAAGVPPQRVACTPLLHGFWGWDAEQRLSRGIGLDARTAGARAREAGRLTDAPLVIFFGRLEQYKGVDTLLDAWRLLLDDAPQRPALQGARLVLAGRLSGGLTLSDLPPGVEFRKGQIEDDEALALFSEAGLLVLPYRDATQTALIAAAARLGVPSLVTRTGALPEYVTEGVTGWTVPPADPRALAAALDRALRDPHRLAEMGAAAHAWYEQARAAEQGALTALYGDSSDVTAAGAAIA